MCPILFSLQQGARWMLGQGTEELAVENPASRAIKQPDACKWLGGASHLFSVYRLATGGCWQGGGRKDAACIGCSVNLVDAVCCNAGLV